MAFNTQAALQAGYSQDEIKKYLSTRQGGQPQSQGGGIADYLPLIGAIGGSFIPGAGTIVGGALGAGAGTLLKQSMQGGGDPGEIIKEAALGGAGGVAGKVIGKVAGKVLPKGAAKVAGDVGGKTGLGVGEKVAAKTIASNFTIPPKLAPQLQLEDSLGQMIQDGIKIPNSIKGYQTIANQVTGDGGAITLAQRSATKQLKTPINFDQALTDARGFVGLKGGLSPDDKLDTVATIRNYFNDRRYPAPGHITADDALDIANQLDKEGYNLYNKGINELSPNAALEAKGEAFIGVAEDLRNQISRGIDSTGVFAKVQAEAVKALEKVSPQIAQRARLATNMAQLRSVAGPYVKISRAAQATINRQQTPLNAGGLQLGTRASAALAGGAVANLPGAAAGAAFGPAAAGAAQAAQPAITGLAARGMIGAGKLAGKVPKPGTLAGATAGQAAVRAGQGGLPEPAGIEEEIPSPATSSKPDDSQLRAAFAMAILQNPKQASAIKSAYDLLAPAAKGGASADRVASLKVGEKAVGEALSQATKGYGPLGGGISSKLLKDFGGAGVPKKVIEANTRYQLLRQSVVRALQGARMSDVDIKLAQEYIPQITDTETTAKEKLKLLKRFLEDTRSNLEQNPNSGESSIPLPQDMAGLGL